MELLDCIIALTREDDRVTASAAIGRGLGGERLLLFVRDDEVGELLPAPGYPQTLPDARNWRRFITSCVEDGKCGTMSLRQPDGTDAPAYGFSSGSDVVGVVVGATQWAESMEEMRRLLPLVVAAMRGERAAAHARAEACMAEAGAAHAESLAVALDGARAQLQRSLGEAERARGDLELLNLQLQDQAMELETQSEELLAQSEELRETNMTLERTRRSAEKANKAKSEFLATMSHELRTPLNAIGGHTQLITMGIYGEVTERQRAALERIDRSQRHLLGLINSILNLARIESGRLEYHIAPVPLSEVLCDIEPMIIPQIGGKSLHYNVELCDSELAVFADRDKLQQILLNLLSNAVKFTEPDGSITLEARASLAAPDRVEIRVVDTGIGIRPDRISDIFEPFVQVDASHSREGQGTGLGLAISRDLARGMEGDLEVQSVPGRGTEFSLTLRRSPSPLLEPGGG